MKKRITQAEFARLLGIRRQTVHEGIKRGRIRKGDDGLLDPVEALRLWRATESPMPHHQAAKRKVNEAKRGEEVGFAKMAKPTFSEASRTTDADAAEIDALNERMALETLKFTRHKVELARLQVEKMAASLVDRADVDAVLAEFLATLERIVGALPARLAPEIAEHGRNVAGIHRCLDLAMHEALTAVSDHFDRLSRQPMEGSNP